MPDLIDEIDDDLRAERARARARRAAPFTIALVVVFVAAIGVWRWVDWRQGRRDLAASTVYFAASQKIDQGGADPAAAASARSAFAGLAADGEAPAGLRALARFRVAGLDDAMSDPKAAIAALDALADDRSVPPELRALAVLQSVQHQIAAADRTALLSRLAPLEAPGAPFRPLALETEAMVDLAHGQAASARTVLGGIVASDAGRVIRERDATLLQAMGAPAGAGG